MLGGSGEGDFGYMSGSWDYHGGGGTQKEEDILGEDSIMLGSKQEGPVGIGWAGTFKKPWVFGGRSKVCGCLGRWWSLMGS